MTARNTGARRMTFVISRDGKILHIFEK